MIQKTFSHLGSVRAMLAAAAILLLTWFAYWQHGRQAAQLADLSQSRSGSQAEHLASTQGDREQAGLLPEYEPRSFRAATGSLTPAPASVAPPSEMATTDAPQDSSDAPEETAPARGETEASLTTAHGSAPAPKVQQSYRVAQAIESPGGDSQPPGVAAPAVVDATAPTAASGAPANLAFPLVHLEPRQLHERLSEAFGEPLSILQDAGSPWLRFTLELAGDSPVLAAINQQSREVRLVGRASDVQGWRQVIGALDAPPQAGRTTALVATKSKAAPHVRQTVDILLAQTAVQGDPAEAATVESAAIEGAAPAEQEAIASLLGPVEIVNVPGTTLFIIRGNPRDVARVREVIREIEERSQLAAPQILMQQLKHVDASTMSSVIAQVFEEESPLSTFYNAPLVVPLVRGNALLIIGSPTTVERTVDVVRAMDVPTEGIPPVKVFRLKNASAEEAEDVLEDLYDGDDNAPDVESLLPRAVVIADASSNSLVVRASAHVLEEIGKLIEQIDQVSDASALLKVFELRHGDAVGLVETLEALFGEADANEQGVFRLRFSVDERTNSVIAAGTSDELLVVETILLRLDTEDSRDRRNQVYKLKNANAEDVAIALQDYIQQKREVQETAAEVISRIEQLEREVVVVPELGSNSLIVSATPEVWEEISQIIDDLDQQAPMVMIQVLIGEVALGDADEFGVELGLQDSVLFDRSVLENEFTTTNSLITQDQGTSNTITNEVIQSADLVPGFLFGNSGVALGNSGSDRALQSAERVGVQGLSSFAVERVSDAFGFGGFVLSASSNSVSLLLRALQESRRLEVLSRPQIMALDNQTGEAFVGQEVPYVTDSTLDPSGGRTNSITLVRVGLDLLVTPRISPDGLVVMDVTAQNSSLGPVNEGIPISIAPNGDAVRAPIINTILADTTVSAVSGQTVVLSGLLTKRDRALHRRVPLLADVPLIGDIFRFDLTSTERAELLIVLTPHVIRNRHEAELIKQVESARMSWCLADVVDLHGPAGLRSRDDSFGAAEAEAIYPQNVLGEEHLPPLEEVGPQFDDGRLTPPGPSAAPYPSDADSASP